MLYSHGNETEDFISNFHGTCYSRREGIGKRSAEASGHVNEDAMKMQTEVKWMINKVIRNVYAVYFLAMLSLSNGKGAKEISLSFIPHYTVCEMSEISLALVLCVSQCGREEIDGWE